MEKMASFYGKKTTIKTISIAWSLLTHVYPFATGYTWFVVNQLLQIIEHEMWFLDASKTCFRKLGEKKQNSIYILCILDIVFHIWILLYPHTNT